MLERVATRRSRLEVDLKSSLKSLPTNCPTDSTFLKLDPTDLRRLRGKRAGVCASHQKYRDWTDVFGYPASSVPRRLRPALIEVRRERSQSAEARTFVTRSPCYANQSGCLSRVEAASFSVGNKPGRHDVGLRHLDRLLSLTPKLRSCATRSSSSRARELVRRRPPRPCWTRKLFKRMVISPAALPTAHVEARSPAPDLGACDAKGRRLVSGRPR